MYMCVWLILAWWSVLRRSFVSESDQLCQERKEEMVCGMQEQWKDTQFYILCNKYPTILYESCDFSQMWILVKSTNHQYLCLKAKNELNEGTLFSATSKGLRK